MGYASALPTNNRLGWEYLPGTNTSLLRIFGNYGREKFYNIRPRVYHKDPTVWLDGARPPH